MKGCVVGHEGVIGVSRGCRFSNHRGFLSGNPSSFNCQQRGICIGLTEQLYASQGFSQIGSRRLVRIGNGQIFEELTGLNNETYTM